MIEPREDEECATCAGFYEPLWDRRGVRVRLDREDRYVCEACARLIAAALATRGTTAERPGWLREGAD